MPTDNIINPINTFCGSNYLYIFPDFIGFITTPLSHYLDTCYIGWITRVLFTGLPPFQITYDGTPIQPALSYKYLGITLDKQLNFGLHVNKIVSSVSGILKQFQHKRSLLTCEAAFLVFKSLMLRVLEYGGIFLSIGPACRRYKTKVFDVL